MSLTGVPADYRTPGTRREFLFATGPGSQGTTRDVLCYCNKTAGGSEVANTIRLPIGDRTDAIARLGIRSEGFALWKAYTAVDKSANFYVCVVPEGAGAAASRTITFVGASTSQTTATIAFQGETKDYTVSTGMTAVQQCAAFVSAFNQGGGGEWQASAAQGAPANDHIATITGSQLGLRLDPLLDDSLRLTYASLAGTTSQTLGALSPGSTDDDFTEAYNQASAGTYFYQINPKTGITGPTTTDNGIGEGIAYLRDQNLPLNGKFQSMHFGLVGTQAQATTVATDSDANTVLAFFWRCEDNDWTAGMIAAQQCAITRAEEQKHPAANLIDYHQTDQTPMPGPPDPYDKTDRPTAAEQEADLRNGVSVIAWSTNGSPKIVRAINSYSELSAGVKDYRASEGHTGSAIAFAWEVLFARWETEKQPYIADDPPAGSPPKLRTSTPSQVRHLAISVIQDLTADRPLGKYEGPILSSSPADVQHMIDSISVKKTSGKFRVGIDFLAVEHLVASEWTLRQANQGYLHNVSTEMVERWWNWDSY